MSESALVLDEYEWRVLSQVLKEWLGEEMICYPEDSDSRGIAVIRRIIKAADA